MKDSNTGSDLTKYFKRSLANWNLKPVGGGRFADVYCLPFNEEFVAVKVIRAHSLRSELSEEEISMQILNEMTTWFSMKHENIVEMIGHCYRPGNPYPCLVLQWMEKGTAKQYVESVPANKLKFYEFIRGIVRGLDFLHGKNYVHRDVRAANILVSDCGEPCLGDFGLSRIQGARLSDTSGNVRWTAFECLVFPRADDLEGCVKIAEDRHTTSSDIWSLGMTIHELISGTRPFDKCRNDGCVVSCLHQKKLPVFKQVFRSDFEGYSQGFQVLCHLCWQWQPDRRPSTATLLTIIDVMHDIHTNFTDTSALEGTENGALLEEGPSRSTPDVATTNNSDNTLKLEDDENLSSAMTSLTFSPYPSTSSPVQESSVQGNIFTGPHNRSQGPGLPVPVSFPSTRPFSELEKTSVNDSNNPSHNECVPAPPSNSTAYEVSFQAVLNTHLRGRTIAIYILIDSLDVGENGPLFTYKCRIGNRDFEPGRSCSKRKAKDEAALNYLEKLSMAGYMEGNEPLKYVRMDGGSRIEWEWTLTSGGSESSGLWNCTVTRDRLEIGCVRGKGTLREAYKDAFIAALKSQ